MFVQQNQMHPNVVARKHLLVAWLNSRGVQSDQLCALVWHFAAPCPHSNASFSADLHIVYANKPRLPHYTYMYGVVEEWDTSRVTMMCMHHIANFDNSPRFNTNVEWWDVHNVVCMDRLFAMCTAFNQSLERWDMRNVVSTSSMFNRCSAFNQPLNRWNVSSVEHVVCMFSGCTSFNQPLDNWNVSNVKSAGYMFSKCKSFNQSLRNWRWSACWDDCWPRWDP